MSGIKAMENIGEASRSIAKLNDNRRQQTPHILFLGVLEVEKEERKVPCPSITDAIDILDDR
jgi:hypothetical protein